MAIKERFQNPTCGDDIRLRMLVYNSNNLRSVDNIEKIDLYFLDPNQVTTDNPDGRTLVETFTSDDVTEEDTGKYLLNVTLSSGKYTIGDYMDVWTITFENEECATATVENPFTIYPDLWFTTPVPPVYDFNFQFRPNRFRKGSKRYLLIQVTPNVPHSSDISKYYENLAIAGDLKISIEQKCGDCIPAETDLRRIVDRESVGFREKCYGYYYIDTTDMENGIYDVWFELSLGENVYISDKNNLEVFD